MYVNGVLGREEPTTGWSYSNVNVIIGKKKDSWTRANAVIRDLVFSTGTGTLGLEGKTVSNVILDSREGKVDARSRTLF